MLATVLLLGLLVVATVTDVRRHTIHNWTTYTGILSALGVNAAGEGLVAWTSAEPEWLARTLGYIGLSESVFGFLLCGFVMVACFVFFSIGGGDVKLIAMLGAFLGPVDGLEAMLWTFVLGGAMGLVVLIWRVGAVTLLVRAVRQVIWTLRLRSWSPLTEEERAQLQTRLFLAPSALTAIILVESGVSRML